MQSLSATVKLQSDPSTGELVLPIPDAWLDALDWRAGDTLKWSKRSSGDLELNNLTKAKRDLSAIEADHSGAANPSTQGNSNHDSTD